MYFMAEQLFSRILPLALDGSWAAVQVLEQSIKWKAAVMQTTLHSAGAAVLPYKKPLMKIIAALFAAPSKVLYHQCSRHDGHCIPCACHQLCPVSLHPCLITQRQQSSVS